MPHGPCLNTDMENTDEISRLALTLHPIFQQYQIQRAILFGSWARGDASRRSDVDLILVTVGKPQSGLPGVLASPT